MRKTTTPSPAIPVLLGLAIMALAIRAVFGRG